MGLKYPTFDTFYWKMVLRIVPGLINSHRVFIQRLNQAVTDKTDWLDLGCGHRMTPSWIDPDGELANQLVQRANSVVGIDCDLPSLERNHSIDRRVGGTIGRLPFASGSFDLVTANMVVEHLKNPQPVLDEIHRVLRPGGVLLIHTPNALCPITRLAACISQRWKNLIVRLLEGRSDQDVFPTYYHMNRTETIKQLAAISGLNVRQIELMPTSAETARLGPLAVFELLWIRLTDRPRFKQFRSSIITVLERPMVKSTVLEKSGTQPVIVVSYPSVIQKAA